MLMGILFLLAVRCGYGVLAQRIAERRGLDRGFVWGFWLGVAGLIVVAFRRTDSSPVPLAAALETRWMCLDCGAQNPAGAQKCQSCLAPRHKERPKTPCPKCGASNHAGNETCFACGENMKKKA